MSKVLRFSDGPTSSCESKYLRPFRVLDDMMEENRQQGEVVLSSVETGVFSEAYRFAKCLVDRGEEEVAAHPGRLPYGQDYPFAKYERAFMYLDDGPISDATLREWQPKALAMIKVACFLDFKELHGLCLKLMAMYFRRGLA